MGELAAMGSRMEDERGSRGQDEERREEGGREQGGTGGRKEQRRSRSNREVGAGRSEEGGAWLLSKQANFECAAYSRLPPKVCNNRNFACSPSPLS